MPKEIYLKTYDKLAAKEERIVKNTVTDLEHHSEIFDLMGFEPSYYNKINIHIGAAYEDKRETAYRFCKNSDRLSDNLKKRLTVENDDKLSLFTTRELYKYMFLDIGSPIVFPSHDQLLLFSPRFRKVTYWSYILPSFHCIIQRLVHP